MGEIKTEYFINGFTLLIPQAPFTAFIKEFKRSICPKAALFL